MTPTTPREALEKAYYDQIGPAFGPPEQLTEAYAARWEARRVRQAKSLTDTALTALAPFMQEWRPIEEAPKDGTPVMLFSRYEGINLARWITQGQTGWIGFADHSDAYDNGENKITVTAPTHFMPLPEPPQVTNEKA
jgi:hypothetical protein